MQKIKKDTPGPGTYQGPLPQINPSFNKGKVLEQFGTGSKRFGKGGIVEPSMAKLPGPGEYQPDISQDAMKNEA